jgi:hypothetical protein
MHYTHFLQRAKGWQLRPLAEDCALFTPTKISLLEKVRRRPTLIELGAFPT